MTGFGGGCCGDGFMARMVLAVCDLDLARDRPCCRLKVADLWWWVITVIYLFLSIWLIGHRLHWSFYPAWHGWKKQFEWAVAVIIRFDLRRVSSSQIEIPTWLLLLLCLTNPMTIVVVSQAPAVSVARPSNEPVIF